jgi:Uma2 family endonuclease
MATVQASAEQRILLQGVSWRTYETLLKEFDERPIRLTYDNGGLEIMTLGHGHEHLAALLRRLVESLTLELNIPIHSGGSTTFKKEAKKRGLEPDECYWIQHEPAMRGKKDFDIDSGPPPDLAIEIDITSSSLDRLSIYATLGVREVWRYDGESFRAYRLRGGAFQPCAQSPALPMLPFEEVLRYFRESDTQDETTLVRGFSRWVREELAPIWEQQGREKRGTRKGGKKKPK